MGIYDATLGRLFAFIGSGVGLVIAAAILLYAGYYGYSHYKQAQSKYSDVSNPSGTREAEVVFYWASWCGHCTKAKPQWEAFSQSYGTQGRDVNGYLVTTRSVDVSDNNNPEIARVMQENEIDTVPQVFMVIGDNKVKLESGVTIKSLEQMVKTVTSSNQ